MNRLWHFRFPYVKYFLNNIYQGDSKFKTNIIVLVIVVVL